MNWERAIHSALSSNKDKIYVLYFHRRWFSGLPKSLENLKQVYLKGWNAYLNFKSIRKRTRKYFTFRFNLSKNKPAEMTQLSSVKIAFCSIWYIIFFVLFFLQYCDKECSYNSIICKKIDMKTLCVHVSKF